MIHDAQVEVTCDREGCRENVFVDLQYVYRSYSGASGHYDSTAKKIERDLICDHDWIVRDGKYYCCSECADEGSGT